MNENNYNHDNSTEISFFMIFNLLWINKIAIAAIVCLSLPFTIGMIIKTKKKYYAEATI